jgi:hypothetical protein
MARTISAVTSRGAGLPGTAAVVMTTSEAAMASPSSARCLARNSSDCTRA